MKKIIIFLFCIFCISSVHSQEIPTIDIIETNEQLDKIIKQLNSNKIEKAQINDFLVETTQIQEQIYTIKQHITQEANLIQKKQNALGNIPENGSKESPILSKQRKEINEQAEKNKTEQTQIDLINTKIDEIKRI